MPIYSYFPQLFQSITYSRQTTRKLSLSTQLSSEALIAHPTPEAPLNLTLIQPSKQPPSPTALIQPPKQPHSPTALILSPEQPHSPTALKSQPVRRVLPVDGLCRRGADSRQPRSQPPTKPRRQAAHASRASLIRPTPPHKKRLRSHPIPGQPRSLHFYMYIYLTCSSMSVTTGFRINPSTHSAQNP